MPDRRRFVVELDMDGEAVVICERCKVSLFGGGYPTDFNMADLEKARCACARRTNGEPTTP